MIFGKKILCRGRSRCRIIRLCRRRQCRRLRHAVKLGELGKFEGEVITIAGSMQGKDEETLMATVSCFEKATGAVINIPVRATLPR